MNVPSHMFSMSGLSHLCWVLRIADNLTATCHVVEVLHLSVTSNSLRSSVVSTGCLDQGCCRVYAGSEAFRK
jgi:hypothetical protein